MGTPAEASAWKMLTDELGRTGVISDSFKGDLFAIAGKIAEQARDRGREEGRAQVQRQVNPLSIKEERYFVEAGRLTDIGLDNRIDELSHRFANTLPGENCTSMVGEARMLAAALLLRMRRGGLYLTSGEGAKDRV